MAIYSIDPVAGSNANPGSEALPFRDFTPLNSGGSVGTYSGHQVQVRRGTELIVNSATRANVVAAGGCTLTAYGDAAAPLPIISGGGTTFNPVWLQSGAGITVERLHIRRSAGTGLQCSPTTGNTLSNIILQDLLLTETVQNNTLFGQDGVTIGGFAQIDPGLVAGVTARRITARDNGGHGLKARGLARNVQVWDSTFIRSGLQTPAHGGGTCGDHYELPTPGAGWTNISGNIWERTIPSSVTGKVTNIAEIFGVIVAGGFPYYQLVPASNPLLPNAGECGLNGSNVLRINIGANPSVLTLCWVIYAVPQDVVFVNCVGAQTADVNPIGTPIEGQGIYFDIGSRRCRSINCAGVDNQGHGAFFNVTSNCSHDGFYSADNGKGAAFSGASLTSRFHNGVYVARAGTPGIEFGVGCTGTAQRNQIVGGTFGITCGNPTTNNIAEDENVFVRCGTRVFQVNSAGARSSDRTTIIVGSGNMTAFRARRAIAAAELVR